MNWSASVRGGIAAALMVGAALGKPPKVDGVFPAGGQRGTEVEVAVAGTLDPWPVEARCDNPQILFSATEKQGVYRVVIGAEVEPGPYLVRFFNPEGAAPPRQFVVGMLPERAQSGSEPMEIQIGELPFLVNGKLASAGEVDRFVVEMQAGEVLVAEVTAYGLDSPLDPILHVRGSRGEQLAFNHDATRLGLDPRLAFSAPAPGRYELQLAAFAYPPRADIRFTGGTSSIYRLALGCEPPTIALPAPYEMEGEDVQRLSLPATVSGRIDPAGEIDRYRFAAKAGEVIRIEVAAAELGSWMDPVVVITDTNGKELKSQDDIDSKTHPDVGLDWTAPADGDFTVEVRDLNGNGGSGMAYQLRISIPSPALEVSAPGGVYAVEPGKTLEIAVKVVRRFGFEGKLEVGIEGLPPGLTSAPVEVSEKGEAKLTVVADAKAASANVPITIWAESKDDPGKRVACRFELKGTNADAGDLLVNHTRRGWLTVVEKK